MQPKRLINSHMDDGSNSSSLGAALQSSITSITFIFAEERYSITRSVCHFTFYFQAMPDDGSIYIYIQNTQFLKHFLSVSSAYVTFSMHFWPLRCLLVSNHSTCFTKIRHQNRGPPRLPRPAFNRRHPPTPPSRHERRLKETSLERKN